MIGRLFQHDGRLWRVRYWQQCWSVADSVNQPGTALATDAFAVFLMVRRYEAGLQSA